MCTKDNKDNNESTKTINVAYFCRSIEPDVKQLVLIKFVLVKYPGTVYKDYPLPQRLVLRIQTVIMVIIL